MTKEKREIEKWNLRGIEGDSSLKEEKGTKVAKEAKIR